MDGGKNTKKIEKRMEKEILDEEIVWLNSISEAIMQKLAKCEEIFKITRMNIIIVGSIDFSS